MSLRRSTRSCPPSNGPAGPASPRWRPVASGADQRGHAHSRRRRSVYTAKDQSYVLAVCTRQQLAHAVFPLGHSTKTEVRAEAAARGLAVADKPDSHDICFIADGDTRGFLARALGAQDGPI